MAAPLAINALNAQPHQEHQRTKTTRLEHLGPLLLLAVLFHDVVHAGGY